MNDAVSQQGTSRQYALRRLRKNRPDLHTQVLAGELSAYAAMKKAGFVKEATPLQILRRAWLKASHEDGSVIDLFWAVARHPFSTGN